MLNFPENVCAKIQLSDNFPILRPANIFFVSRTLLEGKFNFTFVSMATYFKCIIKLGKKTTLIVMGKINQFHQITNKTKKLALNNPCESITCITLKTLLFFEKLLLDLLGFY